MDTLKEALGTIAKTLGIQVVCIELNHGTYDQEAAQIFARPELKQDATIIIAQLDDNDPDIFYMACAVAMLNEQTFKDLVSRSIKEHGIDIRQLFPPERGIQMLTAMRDPRPETK